MKTLILMLLALNAQHALAEESDDFTEVENVMEISSTFARCAYIGGRRVCDRHVRPPTREEDRLEVCFNRHRQPLSPGDGPFDAMRKSEEVMAWCRLHLRGN